MIHIKSYSHVKSVWKSLLFLFVFYPHTPWRVYARLMLSGLSPHAFNLHGIVLFQEWTTHRSKTRRAQVIFRGGKSCKTQVKKSIKRNILFLFFPLERHVAVGTHLDCHPKTQFIVGMWVRRRPFAFQLSTLLCRVLFLVFWTSCLLTFCIQKIV